MKTKDVQKVTDSISRNTQIRLNEHGLFESYGPKCVLVAIQDGAKAEKVLADKETPLTERQRNTLERAVKDARVVIATIVLEEARDSIKDLASPSWKIERDIGSLERRIGELETPFYKRVVAFTSDVDPFLVFLFTVLGVVAASAFAAVTFAIIASGQ